jgi:hypothetical protein
VNGTEFAGVAKVHHGWDTMNGVERLFMGLTVVGFVGLFATLTWAGLIWFGAIAAGN